MEYPSREENSNESARLHLSNKVAMSHDADGDKFRVALIDSHSLTRMSVTQLLEASTHAKRRSEDFIILPFSSADELLSCGLGCRVKLILLSVGSGCVSEDPVCNDINRLKQGLVDVPVVILSEREEPHCILKALRFGVHSYISTQLNPEVVIQALRLIQVGGTFIPTNILLGPFEGMPAAKERGGVFSPTLLQGFTPRQSEVLQLLREGKSNKIIAYELKMQESTVKVHVRQIMKKLKAINRTQVAILAYQIYEEKVRMKNSGVQNGQLR